MTQNLPAQDIEAIALRVVEIIGERLARPVPEPEPIAPPSPLTIATECD
jgi:hypothetical protein